MFEKFTVCMSALSLLKIKEKATIIHLKNRDKSRIEKMLVLGLIPGTIVTLEERFPRFIITVEGKSLEIDLEIANSIYVKINQSEN